MTTTNLPKALLSLLLCTCIGVFLQSCGGGDDPATPTSLPTLSISSLEVVEGNANKRVLLDITLSATSTDTVYVFVESVDGTATAGEDFAKITTTPLVFAPGDLRESIGVDILGDEDFEEDEVFEISLTSPINATLSTIAKGKITLLNDDLNTVFEIPTIGYTTPTSYPNMTLVWQDEFNGTTLNSESWTAELGGNGWGNNELQYYRAENTSIRDGHLVIEAREESFGGRAYTSSRLITRNKYSAKYGRIDIRAAMPYGKGLWPALWMLGDKFSVVGWPACGEIDIMEMVGGSGDNVVHGTAHWQGTSSKSDYSGSYTLPSGNLHNSFHVFSIIWDADKIQWYIDDIKYHELDITDPSLSEFREPFFFIFNVAVGGNWPGSPNASTVFPQRMIVDYVRVFQ